MAINPERALEITGASWQVETIEDYMPGHNTADLNTIFSSLKTARAELEGNIRNSVEQFGEDAPKRIGIVSRPEYYVNGIAVGNNTHLAIDPEFYFHYGSEPHYVQPYKVAQWRSYKALLDRSIDRSDFIDLMDFATTHDDRYFAGHLYGDLQAKKQRPQAYIFTPQDTIDRAEKERTEKNDFIEALHRAIKGHNRKAAKGELEVSQERVDESSVLQNLVRHRRWLIRIGYAKYLTSAFLVPLVVASKKPVIEKRILDKVFSEAGLPASTIAETD